jgi:REP element-mobilizing transposase RayT
MSGYFKFYAYCLLPDHFHLLVKVKSKQEVIKQGNIDFPKGFSGYTDYLIQQDATKRQDFEEIPNFYSEILVSEKFRRFFLSYSKSINKQQKRSGSLFQKLFRRRKILTNDYFTGLIWHIHYNPVAHKIHNDYKTYRWSSFQRILSPQKTALEKKELIEWFSGKEHFISFHENPNIDEKRLNNLIFEIK